MDLTRRGFIGAIVGLPLFRLPPIAARPISFERLPHRLALPREAWSALASAASCLNGFTTVNDFASEEQAKRLVQTINHGWDDLPGHFALYLGLMPETSEKQAVRDWLTGDCWEGRLRWVEALARNGGFRIVWQGKSVVLEWKETL